VLSEAQHGNMLLTNISFASTIVNYLQIGGLLIIIVQLLVNKLELEIYLLIDL
jgi:hypothetical protein